MKAVTENTLIPIGVAIVCIGGAAVWMTTIHLTQTAQANKITEIEQGFEMSTADQRKILEVTHAIKQDVAEIKGELKRLQYKK